MKELRQTLRWLIVMGIVFPFLYLIAMSFTQTWRYPALLPQEWGWQQWMRPLSSQGELLPIALNSIFISLFVAVFSTAVGFFVSKWMHFHCWSRGLLLATYFPFVLSPVILAAGIHFFFIKVYISGTLFGVILAQLMIAFPYSLIIFDGFWSPSILNQEQLVLTLGGNSWQAFWKVTLPLSQGIILVVFFQTFLISWFEYGLTRLIGLGKVKTLTLQVFHFISETNIFLAAQSSVLLFLPPLILLWINRRYIVTQWI